MATKSLSIKAIELARSLFEAIHGNTGLLKFSVEQLTATNGSDGQESKKWKIICSFYETLGSTKPTRYQADVNLYDNTIMIQKLDEVAASPPTVYSFTKNDAEDAGKDESSK